MATAMWRGLRGVCRFQCLLRTKYALANHGRIVQSGALSTSVQVRSFSAGSKLLSVVEGENVAEEEQSEKVKTISLIETVDVDTSMRYMESKAYKITYGDSPVWVPYRRNHKGRRPPEKTREMCIRGGKIATGNPCPICRDKYLVLHPKNVALLKQFIAPQSGEVISYSKTGLCQKQHRDLLVTMHQAWDLGYINKPIPPREYDYAQYYPEYKAQLKELESLETEQQ